MHVSSKSDLGQTGNDKMPEGGWPGAGRPKDKGSNYGKDAHIFGRDPVGSKGFKPSVDLSVKENINTSKSRNVVRNLGIANEIPSKNKKLILESLTVSVKENNDKGTYLDESHITE
jgi:hypothetical protein